MTRAWRTRDFRAVFLLACRAGLTPENIAEMTKLPADLVVSVMKGNETLNSQALIESVARGLGMPENSQKASGVESSSDSPALIPVQQVQKADVGRPSRRTSVRVKSPDHIGVRIAALRHQRGLTQESLAERAGISVESVSKIEQQERSPSLTMLRTLAYALGVPVGEVFGSKGLGKHASEEQAEADYRPSEGNRELQVLDFCTEMTRLMKERGVGVRELARQTSYNASYMSNMRSGRKLPSPKVAEKIDKALEANGRLVAAARSQDAGITLPRADKHRMVSDSPDISPSRLTNLGEIELLRQLVTDTLSQGGIGDASLHEWGQTAIRYARATRDRPAPLLMSDLGHDLAELNRALARQHSTSALRELTRLTGQMAGLMCLMLCVIDDRANFRRWARTARLAGNEAGDPETLSWILAQEAHGHYYSGDTLEAIDVAQRSYEVARTPCTGAALAAALEARAQATLGRDKETREALHRAENILWHLDSDALIPSAFGYNEASFRFHEGNAYTHLRDVQSALKAQERALELCSPNNYTDWAMTRLDRAQCLTYAGEVAEGVQYATETITDLSALQRWGIITLRTREIIGTLPAGAKKLPAVHDLHEMLMLVNSRGGDYYR